MDKRRIGKFKAASEIVFGENAWRLFAALEFVPLDVEYNITQDSINYTGLSPVFKEVPRSETPPFYKIITTTKDGKIDGVIAKEFDESAPLLEDWFSFDGRFR